MAGASCVFTMEGNRSRSWAHRKRALCVVQTATAPQIVTETSILGSTATTATSDSL